MHELKNIMIIDEPEVCANLHIVSKFYPLGSLYDLVPKSRGLPAPQACKIFKEVLTTLN